MMDSLQRKNQLNLQTLESETFSVPQTFQPKRQELRPELLSSLVVNLVLQEKRGQLPPLRTDPQARLTELLHSPAVAALLETAQLLSQNTGLSAEEALKQVLVSLKDIYRVCDLLFYSTGISSCIANSSQEN